jgi:hypothetical protein
MEFTAAYEMACRLLVQGWKVTSVVTDRDGKIHRTFQKAGMYMLPPAHFFWFTTDLEVGFTSVGVVYCAGHLKKNFVKRIWALDG